MPDIICKIYKFYWQMLIVGCYFKHGITKFWKKLIKIACSNVPLYKISVNLENFKFWDQIYSEKYDWKIFKKIKIKIVISIQQCNPVRISTHFVELQIMGPNLPKKWLPKILDK